VDARFDKVDNQLAALIVEQARLRVEVDGLNALITPFATEVMKQYAMW
jgi:hypothetical protein